ncbi:MAG: hypothetical protein IPN03_21050 [Holophagales bacterium]|nr:hypothetical protein [Holophagales bacterium]
MKKEEAEDSPVLDPENLAILIVPVNELWRQESYLWEGGRLFRLAFRPGSSDLDHDLIPEPDDPLAPVAKVTDLWRTFGRPDSWIVSYPPGFGSGQATRCLVTGHTREWRPYNSRCDHALDHGALGYLDYLERYMEGANNGVILVYAGHGETALCTAVAGEGVAEVHSPQSFEILGPQGELRPRLERSLSKLGASTEGEVVVFGPRSDELLPLLVSLLPANRRPARIPDLQRRGMITVHRLLIGEEKERLYLATLEHAMGVRFREAVRVVGSEEVIPAETVVEIFPEGITLPVLREKSFTAVDPGRFPVGTLCEVVGSSVFSLAELPAVGLEPARDARLAVRLDLDANRQVRWSLWQDVGEERKSLATGILCPW